MKKVEFEMKTKLQLTNIRGFLKRKVTRFGSGAKIDCPKEYLDQTVYLVIVDEPKS